MKTYFEVNDMTVKEFLSFYKEVKEGIDYLHNGCALLLERDKESKVWLSYLINCNRCVKERVRLIFKGVYIGKNLTISIFRKLRRYYK